MNHSALKVTHSIGAFFAVALLPLMFACNGQLPLLSADTDSSRRHFNVYVEMPDGVALAVDVRLPNAFVESEGVPAIVEFTRYWRATETYPQIDNASESARQSLQRGFAYVSVDVRGSGASFGVRGAEFSLAEARDMPHVINWIADQSWSSGQVISMGVSYPGNTAEMAGLYRSPALHAAVPRFTDFDWYSSIVVPGGLKNAYITERWGDAVRRMDLNDASLFGEHVGEPSTKNPQVIGVMPVDADTDRAMLANATRQHQANRSLADNLGDLVYRDEYPSAAGLDDAGGMAVSIHNFEAEFEASAVPMYHWGSWFDAGTAAGVLARFKTFDAPNRYVIGAWSHGANYDANPYLDKNAPVDPGINEQYDRIFEFANNSLEARQQVSQRELLYFTLGENVWKTTTVWPPAGHEFSRMWLSDDALLAAEPPTAAEGFDVYRVDFSAGSGSSSRWATQLGGGDVWYGDRAEEDQKLLTYTSKPVTEDTELTGTAIVSLQLSSSHEDAAIIVYLEDVDESGYVRMLTEGQLRLLHRKTIDGTDDVFGPKRSYESDDGSLIDVGASMQVDLALLPISAVIQKGHSIRIAIAGHDKDTFLRVPQEGEAELRIYRDRERLSYIDLPTITHQ